MRYLGALFSPLPSLVVAPPRTTIDLAHSSIRRVSVRALRVVLIGLLALILSTVPGSAQSRSHSRGSSPRGGHHATPRSRAYGGPRATTPRGHGPRPYAYRSPRLRSPHPRAERQPHPRATRPASPRSSHSRHHSSKEKRSAKAKDDFKRQTGYPHGRRGYVIDHVRPLACGGADASSNMQWQSIADAKAKDKVERRGC